jgi:hypothetical protein
MDVGNAGMYENGPIFSKNSNDLQYLVANFGKLHNLSELLLSFSFKNA